MGIERSSSFLARLAFDGQMVEPSTPSRSTKLPFLSRSRPHWSRRSVAGGDVASTRSSDSNADNGSDPSRSSNVSGSNLSRPSFGPSAALGTEVERLTAGAGYSAALTERALIGNLVKRITTRLPCNSGGGSTSLEQADAIRQAARSLQDFAKNRLGVVLALLLHELELLSKPPYQNPNGFVSLELLRSQLVLLRVVAGCTTHHWAAHNVSDRARRATTPAGPLLDPLPLEESLARQVVSLATLFLKLHYTQAEAPNSGNYSANISAPVEAKAALEAAIAVQGGEDHGLAIESEVVTREAVTSAISSAAGTIAFFVSASNWSAVLSRVKGRLTYSANADDTPDLSEVRLLEWCCLDRRRISAVIQDLCNTFIHLKRPAQAAVSIILHRAIWAWIECFPTEFAALATSGRRLEGGADLLFDIIFSLAEASKKKAIAWQLMATLLICCPDIVAKIAVGEGGRSSGLIKKVQFFESLRKGLKGDKVADVVASCYVEFFRAANYTQSTSSEPSALRLLVADLETDFKLKIFDPTHPFTTSEGLSDIPLTTQALVALYRLDPARTIQSPFLKLLAAPSASASKLTAVYAALVLVREGRQPSWSPSCDLLLSSSAHSIRQLFLDTIASDYPGSISQHDAVTPSYQHEFSPRNEIIRVILKLWSTDLRFLTYNVQTRPIAQLDRSNGSTRGQADSLSSVLLAITGLLDATNALSVRSPVAETILALQRATETAVGVARDEAFAESALEVTYGICKYVVESKHDPQEQQKALELLLHDLMRYQAFFAAAPSAQAIALVSETGWAGHWAAVEVALLVSITSSNSESRALAILCFQRAAVIVESTDRINTAVQYSTDAILAFAKEFQGRIGTNAAVDEQQKQVRSVLSRLSAPTPGVLAAWDESFRRWKDLGSLLGYRAGDESDENDLSDFELIGSTTTSEQQFSEWSHLSGFLLAGSGVCTPGSEFMRLHGIVPSGRLPPRFFRRADRGRGKHLDGLCQELVDLLVSDSIKVRDGVKDVLGSDLSHLQYPIFFKHLYSIVGHFLDNERATVTEDGFTVFIEQTISVLRLMFDRLVEPLTKLATTTLDGLLLSFTIYVQRLGTSLHANRLKIRLCQLCEVVLVKRGPATLERDSAFRNELVEHLVSWSSDSQPQSNSEDGYERLRRDLDAACLKAMVASLNGLVVHSAEVDRAQPVKTNARLFSRYFDFFSYTLQRLGDPQLVQKDSSSKLPSGVDPRTNREELSKASTRLRDCTVDALSNLISANAELAQKHFLTMGTTMDVSTRAAYIKVLVKVVDKGTQLTPAPPQVDPYFHLVALLRQPDLTLALALCEVCTVGDYDHLTEVLMKVFHTPQSMGRFLKAIIELEVSVADQEGTLFRGNSFATRILTVYARARGYHYLRNTLNDLFVDLCNKPVDFSLDFDPHRPSDESTASHNLEQVTEAFLVAISESVEQVPTPIREICHFIGEAVGSRFPDSIFTAHVPPSSTDVYCTDASCRIGGFFFLRFINPAIVSPETIDLDLSSDTREIRRGLVMITKVLQALANNVRFGAKEPGMAKLNSFMDINIFGMTRLLQSISRYSSSDDTLDGTKDSTAEPGPGLDDTDRSFLSQFIRDHSDKLAAELTQGKEQEARLWYEKSDAALGAQTWEKTQGIVAAIAPSKDASTIEGSPEQAYRTFMSRNELKTTSLGLWNRVFYETKLNKSGATTFCFVLHRIRAETADIESLLFYVLKRLSNVSGSIEILVDTSQFSIFNEVPTHWITQFIAILPTSKAQQISRIMIYKPNTLFKRYVRKLGRLLHFERLDSRRVLAVASMGEMEDYFTSVETVLSPSTLSLSREKRTTHRNITERSPVKVEHPVIFKLGDRTLLVRTVKKHDLFSDVRSTLDDIIELADIEEVRKVSMGTEGDGISILVHGESTARHFLVTSRRDETFAALLNSRKDAPSQPRNRLQLRSSNGDDASSALLNTVLFNLCSSSATLRSQANDLFHSLGRHYQLEGLAEKETLSGLYIPSVNLAFVTSVSERLAGATGSQSLSVLVHFASSLSLASSTEACAYLHCLRPWLHNLHTLAHTPRDQYEVVQAKLQNFVRQLIKIGSRDAAIHAVLCSRIYPALGKIEYLIPTILNEAVRAVTTCAPDADPYSQFSEILVAVSAGTLLRGKLLARLRKAIARSSLKSYANLSLSPDWLEILTLVRFELAVSFDSRVQAQLYLPDLCHIIVSVSGAGDYAARYAVRQLTANVVHSLTKDPSSEVNVGKLRSILETLTSTEGGDDLFEVSGGSSSRIGALPHERLVALLVEVIEAAAPSIDTANAWRARWISLSTAVCFTYNPALQVRAFSVLTALGDQQVDGDLVYQMLTALRASILLAPAANDESLAVSIIRCIIRTSPERNSPSSFFLAVAMLQIGNPRIYAASIELLGLVIDGLADGGWFEDQGMGEALLSFRDSAAGSTLPCQLIDECFGVDFQVSFTFSLAVILAKGVKFPPTATATISVLLNVLRITSRSSSRTLSRDALPFFLVLIPTMAHTGRLAELLATAGMDDLVDAGLSDLQTYSAIVPRLGVNDHESVTLATALLVTFASVVDSENESLAIFTILGKLASDHPAAAGALHSLMPVITTLIDEGCNVGVIDAARSMFAAMAAPTSAGTEDLAPILLDLGFSALVSSKPASFSPEDLKGITPLQVEISELVSTLISETLSNPQ